MKAIEAIVDTLPVFVAIVQSLVASVFGAM